LGIQFPKVHEIKELIVTLEKLGIKEVKKLKKETGIMENLEVAYISLRYLSFSFTKSDVKKAISFVKKLRRILWKKC